MKTIQLTRAQELQARHAKEMAELLAKEKIESILPASLPLPTISNISEGKTRAWLSFSPAYGEDAKAFAIRIFTELEKACAEPLPLSLVKWDNYRRTVEHGTVESILDSKPGSFGRTSTLTDVEAIAPLWVTLCQFTGVDAKAYYRIGGDVYKVSVKAPLPTHLSCRKIQHIGGWRFDGACTIQFPQHWHSIHTESGESVANISQHTRGYRDTEQGISGDIYWQPLTEQDAFPLTPAQFLAQLFAK